MPILLERMEDLKEYVEENPQAHVFYKRKDRVFEVLAGKVAWAGELQTEKDADTLESFLRVHGATEVKGWVELEELFSS
jgi:hypothetical protein